MVRFDFYLSIMSTLNRFLLFLLIGIFWLITIPIQTVANDQPKLILIHLDAVSTHYFEQELEKGNLPNIKGFFGEEGIINHTITYFPSKTPVVISSIREGETQQDAELPGWKWNIEEMEGLQEGIQKEEDVGLIGSFLKMAFSKSRLSTTTLIYGLPVFHWMAGPAFVNLADYLKDYDVLQFYWYNIDTQGHFNGEEAYLEQFAAFDKQLGRLIRRLDDDVNIIIYSDHGMVFGEGVDADTMVENVVGDNLGVYSFPSLYLQDPTTKSEYAKKLVEDTDIDFTFFRSSDYEVTGFHKDGTIRFIKNIEEESVRYEYSDTDLLRYYDKGYNGEYLTREEWLELTHSINYPLAPINIYYYTENPRAGDIITLFEADKFHQTGYSSSGNHGGFTSLDMSVPLLIHGPDVESLKDRDYFWLPELFMEIDNINFNAEPNRERHFLGSRYDFKRDRFVTDISLSPSYRLNYGASLYSSDFSEYDRIDVWGKADLFRSYLTRTWVGVGVEIKDSGYTPFFMFNYDINIRRFVIQNSFATNRQYYFRMAYEATDWFALTTVNFNSLGVRFDF